MRVSMGETLRNHEQNQTPIPGHFGLNQPILAINNADITKQDTVFYFNNFRDHTALYRNDTDIFGTSTLFTTNNPTWKALRSKFGPFFSSGKLKQMFYLMNDATRELRNFIVNQDERATHTATKEICAKYATSVISSCASGIKSHCFCQQNSEFRICTKRLLNWKSLKEGFLSALTFIATALRLKFWHSTSGRFLKTVFLGNCQQERKH